MLTEKLLNFFFINSHFTPKSPQHLASGRSTTSCMHCVIYNSIFAHEKKREKQVNEQQLYISTVRIKLE